MAKSVDDELKKLEESRRKIDKKITDLRNRSKLAAGDYIIQLHESGELAKVSPEISNNVAQILDGNYPARGRRAKKTD